MGKNIAKNMSARSTPSAPYASSEMSNTHETIVTRRVRQPSNSSTAKTAATTNSTDLRRRARSEVQRPLRLGLSACGVGAREEAAVGVVRTQEDGAIGEIDEDQDGHADAQQRQRAQVENEGARQRRVRGGGQATIRCSSRARSFSRRLGTLGARCRCGFLSLPYLRLRRAPCRRWYRWCR